MVSVWIVFHQRRPRLGGVLVLLQDRDDVPGEEELRDGFYLQLLLSYLSRRFS